MNTPFLISTAFLTAVLAAGLTSQQLVAQEAPTTQDHEPAQVQALPDYVREADSNGFAGVTEAIFLGRAGIGEYWQYKQGEDTCVGLFYREDGKPYMSGVCGDPEEDQENGFSFTSVVQDGDDVIAQAAWFSGSWDSKTSNEGAIIRYAAADGSRLADDADPLTSLFSEEETAVGLSTGMVPNGTVSILQGQDLTLKTS